MVSSDTKLNASGWSVPFIIVVASIDYNAKANNVKHYTRHDRTSHNGPGLSRIFALEKTVEENNGHVLMTHTSQITNGVETVSGLWWQGPLKYRQTIHQRVRE